jgi:hypothetical protein
MAEVEGRSADTGGTSFDPTVYDPQPEHHCKVPEPSAFGPRGWRCNCGKAFRLVTETQHGETWVQWERMKIADEHRHKGSGGDQ